MNFVNKKRGFTLVELLAVVFIIGILVSLILAYFNGTKAKSRDARRKEELKEIENALSLYQGNHDGSFPIVLNDLVPGYIQKIPQDPLGNNQPYFYKVSDSRNFYEINARLEINDGTADNDGGNQPYPIYEKGNDLTLLP